MPPKVFQPAQDPFDDWEQASFSNTSNASQSYSRPTPSSNAALWDAPAYIPYASQASSSAAPFQQMPQQPKMTILQRPSSTQGNSRQSSGDSAGSQGANPPKSLKQREQEYKDARARIFGEEPAAPTAAAADSSNRSSRHSSPKPTRPNSRNSSAASLPAATSERAPQGPSSNQDKGFGGRRRPNPSSSQTSSSR